jgi:hypothetical protein
MQMKQVSVKDGTVDWRGTKMVTIFGFQQSFPFNYKGRF